MALTPPWKKYLSGMLEGLACGVTLNAVMSTVSVTATFVPGVVAEWQLPHWATAGIGYGTNRKALTWRLPGP